MKNPLGLNQAEIVAGLALDLVKHSRRVINPVTKQPFRVKFGRKLSLFCFFISFSDENRFSFWFGCWWNCRSEEFSILFIRGYDQYGRRNRQISKIDFSCLSLQASRITTTGEVNQRSPEFKSTFLFFFFSAWTNPFERYILRSFERFTVFRYPIQRSNGIKSKREMKRKFYWRKWWIDIRVAVFWKHIG